MMCAEAPREFVIVVVKVRLAQHSEAHAPAASCPLPPD